MVFLARWWLAKVSLYMINQYLNLNVMHNIPELNKFLVSFVSLKIAKISEPDKLKVSTSFHIAIDLADIIWLKINNNNRKIMEKIGILEHYPAEWHSNWTWESKC